MSEARARWWLIRGELAAKFRVQEDTHHLTFEGDDGERWSFRLASISARRPSMAIGWDYQSSTLITDESVALDLERALHTAMWEMARTLGHLSPRETEAIEAIARTIERGEWVERRALVTRLGSVDDLDASVRRLRPRYVRTDEGAHGEVYSLTLAGALISSVREDASDVIEAVLRALRNRLSSNPRAREYSLQDIDSIDHCTPSFVDAVVGIARLRGRGSSTGATTRDRRWAMPGDAGQLRRLETTKDFVEAQRKSTLRPWLSAPLRMTHLTR